MGGHLRRAQRCMSWEASIRAPAWRPGLRNATLAVRHSTNPPTSPIKAVRGPTCLHACVYKRLTGCGFEARVNSMFGFAKRNNPNCSSLYSSEFTCSAIPTTRITSSRASLPIRSADKIRNHRDTSPQPACGFLAGVRSTSSRIHSKLLLLIFFLSNKQADYYFAALGYQHKHEFCHSQFVFFQQNRVTIGLACAQAVLLRGSPTTACRHVDAPRDLQPLHMAYDDHDRNFIHIHGFA